MYPISDSYGKKEKNGNGTETGNVTLAMTRVEEELVSAPYELQESVWDAALFIGLGPTVAGINQATPGRSCRTPDHRSREGLRHSDTPRALGASTTQNRLEFTPGTCSETQNIVDSLWIFQGDRLSS